VWWRSTAAEWIERGEPFSSGDRRPRRVGSVGVFGSLVVVVVVVILRWVGFFLLCVFYATGGGGCEIHPHRIPQNPARVGVHSGSHRRGMDRSRAHRTRCRCRFHGPAKRQREREREIADGFLHPPPASCSSADGFADPSSGVPEKRLVLPIGVRWCPRSDLDALVEGLGMSRHGGFLGVRLRRRLGRGGRDGSGRRHGLG